MRHEAFEIEVERDPPGNVRAVWTWPDPELEGAPAVLLAHGAGLPHDAPFMVAIAEGLGRRGLPVLRFDYPYASRMAREGRRFPPNRMPELEDTHRRALAELNRRLPERPVLLAGKSMGGRVSSLIAAAGAEAVGCAFLGYPLHPPKKPQNLRVDHFPDLRLPCLFLQGTRDALAPLASLRPHLETIPARVELHVVEGADHGYELPKRMGRAPEDVLDELSGTIASFASSLV